MTSLLISPSSEKETSKTEVSPPLTSATDGTTTSQASPAWVSTYSSLKSSLPASISSHLPQPAALETQVSFLAATSSSHLSSLQRSGTQRLRALKQDPTTFHAWRKEVATSLSPDQLFKQAYSITNTTELLLNVSLNQLSPLFYTVLAPNRTYEVRVPSVYFAIEIRPHTSPKTAYNPWSVTWPILLLTGPIVAATSLLLVPFAALAVGGTALASLTGFGAAVVDGAGATAGALTSAGGTAAGLVAKAVSLPGGGKVKGKLVEAGKKAWGEKGSDAVGGLVKYLGKGTAVAAAGGAVGGEHKEVEREKREKEKKKLTEVDVTGFELEKVLKCETGKRKVDHVSFSLLFFVLLLLYLILIICCCTGFIGSFQESRDERRVVQSFFEPCAQHHWRTRS